MGQLVSNYGLDEQFGRDQQPFSYFGALRTDKDGRKTVQARLDLKNFKNGETYVFKEFTFGSSTMVIESIAEVMKAGVGAASFDIGIVGVLTGTTLNDANGIVGGCPTSDEGDIHVHQDQDAASIGVLINEPFQLTITPNGQYTDGHVVFTVSYRVSLEDEYMNDQGINPDATPNHKGGKTNPGRY